MLQVECVGTYVSTYRKSKVRIVGTRSCSFMTCPAYSQCVYLYNGEQENRSPDKIILFAQKCLLFTHLKIEQGLFYY